MAVTLGDELVGAGALGAVELVAVGAAPVFAPVVTLVLALLIASTPPALRVAVPQLKLTRLDATLAEPYSETLAAQFTGFKVVSQGDIATLLGLERQRQLLGCQDEVGSCTAELASALGADAVVLGEVFAAGSLVQLNLRAIAPDGARLAAVSATAHGEEETLKALTALGRQLAAALRERLVRNGATAVDGVDALVLRRSWGLWPLLGGAAVATAGAVFMGLALDGMAQLTGRRPLVASPEALRRDGPAFEATGYAGLAVGGSLLLAGAALLIFGADAPATLSVSPGGSVSFAWRLP